MSKKSIGATLFIVFLIVVSVSLHILQIIEINKNIDQLKTDGEGPSILKQAERELRSSLKTPSPTDF